MLIQPPLLKKEKNQLFKMPSIISNDQKTQT